MARRGRIGASAVVVVLAGCVVVPQTREVYDPDCRVARKEVTLEMAVIGGFVGCSGQECAALLATLGVVTAASAVVSGSVAVVGNVVYWLEHRGRCAAAGEGAPAPAPPAPRT